MVRCAQIPLPRKHRFLKRPVRVTIHFVVSVLQAPYACLLVLLAWPSLTAAQTVELTPSKTNTLIQVTSSAGSAQLSNGQGDIYVGRTNQDGQGPATISIRRGLMAFDIADNVPPARQSPA